MAKDNEIMRKLLSGNVIILLMCMTLSVVNCSTTGTVVSTVKDPFPDRFCAKPPKYKGWDSFLLPISNGDPNYWLGRVYKMMRGNLRQGEKAWTARHFPEPEERSRIEKIVYTSETFGKLSAHFQSLNIQGKFEIGREMTFTIEFRDISTVEMVAPVMFPEARKKQNDEYYTGPFIDSVLMAKIVAMKIDDRVHGELGVEADIIQNFLKLDPKFSWDNKLNAIRIADNALIGYTLYPPDEADFNRTME